MWYIIDCSEAKRKFCDKLVKPIYPRKMLLELVLMSVFDGKISSHEIKG